jgi:radical S-adenosyl methionine domain-containing protein 2
MGLLQVLPASWPLLFPITLTILTTYVLLSRRWPRSKKPISVNYHFTRKCNKTCGFCFHTALTSHIEKIEDAKRGLALLARAGMKKLNFAGGEPFLYPKFLGDLAKYGKETLHLESISIVTNGSLVNEAWFKKYAAYIDIMAVSCDSFNEATNIAIGRGAGNNVQQLFQIKEWCEKYGIKFKLNTVVCRLNHHEDMNNIVFQLAPFRWKCFQVLMVKGENDSEITLRDVRKFQISDEEFEAFCKRHESQPSFVPESNRFMHTAISFLMSLCGSLTERGRSQARVS